MSQKTVPENLREAASSVLCEVVNKQYTLEINLKKHQYLNNYLIYRINLQNNSAFTVTNKNVEL